MTSFLLQQNEETYQRKRSRIKSKYTIFTINTRLRQASRNTFMKILSVYLWVFQYPKTDVCCFVSSMKEPSRSSVKPLRRPNDSCQSCYRAMSSSTLTSVTLFCDNNNFFPAEKALQLLKLKYVVFVTQRYGQATVVEPDHCRPKILPRQTVADPKSYEMAERTCGGANCWSLGVRNSCTWSFNHSGFLIIRKKRSHMKFSSWSLQLCLEKFLLRCSYGIICSNSFSRKKWKL